MSMREVQAFEDVVTELTGAMHHAGQALASSAAAVALMATAEKEANLPRKLVNDPAETVGGPPHFVGMHLKQCYSNARKTVCQLRRHDTDAWLWTSRPYVDAKRAERDAKKQAKLYGWQVVSISGDAGRTERELPTDATVDPISLMVEWVMRVADTQHPVTPSTALQEIAKILATEIDDESLPHYNVVKPDAEQSDAFQRGFDAGVSTKLALVRALADWVTAAHQGKERMGDVLGEIAVILEQELKVEPGTMWPLQLTGKLAGTDAIGVNHIMRMLLSAKKGGVYPDALFGAIAKKVEELMGLQPGAVWVDGSSVDWAAAVEQVKAEVPAT